MDKEHIYINGMYCKMVQAKFGSILKVSFDVDTMIQELNKYKKGVEGKRAYMKAEIKERREPDKNGNTHYVELDTYVAEAHSYDKPKTNSQPQSEEYKGIRDTDDEPEDDGLPF